MNGNIFSRLISQNFNQSLVNSEFCRCLKQPEAIPIFKKKKKHAKSNYKNRDISPVISKIYERLMYDQVYKYFGQIFPKFQCCFCKGFSTQNCLLFMIENWKESLNQGGHYGALLTNLSRAFDCIMRGLLIVKLQGYGFDSSLNFIGNYLLGSERESN